MSRPKSMSDFTNLFDTTYTPLAGYAERDRRRKKPSISLAAGLIMNGNGASETQSPASPRKSTTTSSPQQPNIGNESGWSEGLFYAYAQKDDYAQSPPYILTFASAQIASQWWSLVKSEYPGSTRVGPQLFILKGDDMQEQIQDNPRFFELQNKWFYTPSEGSGGAAVIPLQDWKGNPVMSAPAPTPSRPPTAKSIPEEGEDGNKKESGFDMAKLSETLDKMNSMISENSAQIRALSVAQSEGLQRMQEINESNSTQIKALADGQSKLQGLMEQNASHYIALSNSSFSTQEGIKHTLQMNAEQIHALADGQSKLATTCAGLMKTISSLGSTIGKVGDSVRSLGSVSKEDTETALSTMDNRISQISPAPRKLNRRIKGVWYEYDTESNVEKGSPPRKKSVAFLETSSKAS